MKTQEVVLLCVIFVTTVVAITVLLYVGADPSALVQFLTLVLATLGAGSGLINMKTTGKIERNTNGHLSVLAEAAGLTSKKTEKNDE